MKTLQIYIDDQNKAAEKLKELAQFKPDVTLSFGAASYFANDFMKNLSKEKIGGLLVGCSTAGEISDRGISDNSLIVTGLKFEEADTRVRGVSVQIENMDHSFDAGVNLGKKIDLTGLQTLLVLGRGLDINGSAVLDGLRSVVGPKVTITGGLAGDGGAFKKTFTVFDGTVSDSSICAIAFYGKKIHSTFGSFGGWEPFGPIRKVTKSKNNIMYQLDGEPALGIYKKYLGDLAAKLPASGLMYPFALLKDNHDTSGIIRTILAVDEKEGSLTFAGDIPVDGLVRLMHSKNEGLVNGAKVAASKAFESAISKKDGLGILISCVGRKLVMGDDTDDEIDAVKQVFGKNRSTGFYSYGEICPAGGFSECKLHNQTMTITFIGEGDPN